MTVRIALDIPDALVAQAERRVTITGRTLHAELLDAIRRGMAIDVKPGDGPMVAQSSEVTSP